MRSLIGDYICKADAKNRVVVPASLRKALEGEVSLFVLRKNIFENCLEMYPMPSWETLVEGLRKKLNPFNQKHAAFLRELFRGVQEVEMDANGRVLLPRKMLDDIGASGDLVFVGQDTKIEVWDSAAYAASGMDGDSFAEMTNELFTNMDN